MATQCLQKIFVLFPCADALKEPQIGCRFLEARYLEDIEKDSFKKKTPAASNKHIKQKYINDASTGLMFDEEVVRERCFHLLPYSTKYFYEALDPSGIVSLHCPLKHNIGHHNRFRTVPRHAPCYLKSLEQIVPDKGKSKKAEKLPALQKVPAFCEIQHKTCKESILDISGGSFMTHLSSKESKADESSQEDIAWDAYLMTLLNVETAKWIVYTRTNPNEGQKQLIYIMQFMYGKQKAHETIELIKDNASVSEASTAPEEKSKWNKDKILSKVFEKYEKEDASSLPFCQQPVGVRRQIKQPKKEELVNITARELEVKRFQPLPSNLLKNYLNMKVGSTFYNTDNLFQQEQLIGVEQIYQAHEDKMTILMSSQNRYQKHLQLEFPPLAREWYPEEKKELDRLRYTNVSKGHVRWTKLPDIITDSEQSAHIESDVCSSTDTDDLTLEEIRLNPSLTQIVEDWRKKWNIHTRFNDSSYDDLLSDMTSIQTHIRLKAITTVAKAATFQAMPTEGFQLESAPKDVDPETLIPLKMFTALECLLEDPNDRVKKASALTLLCFNKPCLKAVEVLREMLNGNSVLERWTAAHGLGHHGICDSDIISEIIKQIFSTSDVLKHERGIHLLVKLSMQSSLVHSMVAEQLNSSSWSHRMMACKILPLLHGHVNKDIVNKLAYMMWNDWHSKVRKSAAQALGKTGHGREVHDDLVKKLQDKDVTTRLDALAIVSYLGIMTAKLLMVFMPCFSDESISIRSEACITSGNLRIVEPKVLGQLLHMAMYDPLWKLKALAMQALGKIGAVNNEIKQCLLWAVRYEDNSSVRAAACHAVSMLGLKTFDIICTLQERLLVETSTVVIEELVNALASFGVNPTAEIEEVRQVKKEVRKLGTQQNITHHVILADKELQNLLHIKRLLPDDLKREALRTFSKILSTKKGSSCCSASVLPPIIGSKTEKKETSMYSAQPSRESAIQTLTLDEELEATLQESEGEVWRAQTGLGEPGSSQAPGSTQSTKMPRRGDLVSAEFKIMTSRGKGEELLTRPSLFSDKTRCRDSEVERERERPKLEDHHFSSLTKRYSSLLDSVASDTGSFDVPSTPDSYLDSDGFGVVGNSAAAPHLTVDVVKKEASAHQ